MRYIYLLLTLTLTLTVIRGRGSERIGALGGFINCSVLGKGTVELLTLLPQNLL